ncbi:MAG: alpha-amylase family glycosyl hydrolase [Gaiellaceae bacterium]
MPRFARRSAGALALAAVLVAVLVGANAPAATPPGGAELAALARPPVYAPIASERIYFVMTDRYANGDTSNDSGGHSGDRSATGFDPAATAFWHGGDFKGLTGGCTDPVHGLQRIKNLGFNAIWVTPAVVNTWGGDGAGYHGYWGLDFTRVDPHLGTDGDFADFVSCAHSLGLKVILDVVVNHTTNVILLKGGTTYSSAPDRDCHDKVYNPAKYVGTNTFPCQSARYMPHVPYFLPGTSALKKPDWLNNPLNYHDRGDIDFSSCSEACYENGDFYGLDDLFTEKPLVEKGLAQIYAEWVTKYKLDGFRVDTARHVNAGFFKLWAPQILAAAKSAGVPDFQIFGEVSSNDAIDLSTYVRDRGLPNVLDFPFQDAAAGYASGTSSALGLAHRLEDDDYFRTPSGVAPTPVTFLGNHDMGRAAFQIQSRSHAEGDALLRQVELGDDLLYLLRGAPVVYYGDEVGMIGSGGDQQAREDMFPTQVAGWKTEPRVASPPIGNGSSFDVTDSPLEAQLRALAALRQANPALSTGATIVRAAQQGVLVVSRIDTAARREYVAAFNSGSATARITVPTATPSASWARLYGTATTATSGSDGRLALDIPAASAVLLRAGSDLPVSVPPTPVLKVAVDGLSSMFRASATVATSQPLSVAFAVRRGSAGAWRRLAVDDSAPYRAFVEPQRYHRGERLSLVAIARNLDGTTSVSAIVPFTVPKGSS